MSTIHLLEVGPDDTPEGVAKLARRFAMTGGVEIALRRELSGPDLTKITDRFLPQLEEFPPGSAKRRSNHAFRILKLVSEHELADAELQKKLAEVLRGNF